MNALPKQTITVKAVDESRLVLKKRRGRSYMCGADYDTGRIMTSTNDANAVEFGTVEAVNEFASQHGLSAADWKLVRV